MMIHDFKTLLSKVKVGDEVIVNWAHKYERGSWSLWSKDRHRIYSIQDGIIHMHHVDYERQHFDIDELTLKQSGFKFELPE